MKKIVLFLLTCAFCHMSYAQKTFSQMRSSMNSNSLPLVNITVDYSALNKETFIDGKIEIADYKKRTEGKDYVKYNCKFRIRGVWASNMTKKSLAVKLFDQNGNDLDVSLFGIRPENSWILDAMAVDRIRMRNRICFDLWNEMCGTPYDTKYNNRNGTLGEFVEVYVNGVYFGLYCFTDKINRKLLNLKKYNESTNTVRGIIYKGESSRRPGHDLLSYDNADVNQRSWNAWDLQYPEDYPSIDTWKPMMNLIDLCSPKTSDSNFLKKYQEYFYADNIVDYLVMTTALNVGDNVYKNTILSTPNILDGHRFLYSPWDMDHSLGGRYNGDYENTMADPHRYDDRAPFDRLYGKGLDGFPNKVSKRWKELKDGVFSIEHVNSLLDKYKERFVASGAWSREYDKWNGTPVALKKNLSEEIDYVKDWYSRNHAALCDYWIIKGDVNCDGQVTFADIDEVVKVIMGNSHTDGDVNGDRKVNAADIVEIANIIYNTSTPGAKISINLKIINNSSSAVTLDGKVQFILANPDNKGNYHGTLHGQPYTGAYNDSGSLVFSSSKVTIAAGQSQTFEMKNVEIAGGEGLGGRSPINPNLISSKRNVYLLANGKNNVVLVNNMDYNIEFSNGKTYTITIP